MIRLKRFCWIENNICHIPLNNGEVAFCDEDRFEEVNKHSWSIDPHYVRTSINDKCIRLHKFLYPNLKFLDHINGNKLDNRSCNLRKCTPQQNIVNRGIGKKNKSGFKGVYKNSVGTWSAQIKGKYLGTFDCPIKASKVYNEHATKIYGDFAWLNQAREGR